MNPTSLLDRIQADLANAMKARDADTLSTLRMLKAALMETKTRKSKDATLTVEEEIDVLQRYVKKRREAIEEFRKHGVPDRIAREEQEVVVTQRYLPQAMPDEELMNVIRETVASTGSAGPRDMGKVIGAVMAKVKGRAEGGTVSRLVKDVLAP